MKSNFEKSLMRTFKTYLIDYADYEYESIFAISWKTKKLWLKIKLKHP